MTIFQVIQDYVCLSFCTCDNTAPKVKRWKVYYSAQVAEVSPDTWLVPGQGGMEEEHCIRQSQWWSENSKAANVNVKPLSNPYSLWSLNTLYMATLTHSLAFQIIHTQNDTKKISALIYYHTTLITASHTLHTATIGKPHLWIFEGTSRHRLEHSAPCSFQRLIHIHLYKRCSVHLQVSSILTISALLKIPSVTCSLKLKAKFKLQSPLKMKRKLNTSKIQ